LKKWGNGGVGNGVSNREDFGRGEICKTASTEVLRGHVVFIASTARWQGGMDGWMEGWKLKCCVEIRAHAAMHLQ
jgi:hypothetical protein